MYNRNSNIMPVYGQLSFRQGQTRAVGLPLDVIDKVGTSMTANYHRNRQAFSKMQADVLNLPDTNSETNKKIIEQMTQNVKDAFSEYEKEGNWWNADDAVYDTMDKMISDPMVKDLQQYASQASRTDKEIEDSGAAQGWKDARRAYNQANNKGIREVDVDGNITNKKLNWQGKGLAGNLDQTKYMDKAAAIIKDWKPDQTVEAYGPTRTSGYTTDEGFNAYLIQYGKKTTEFTNANEIQQFVMNYVLQDPQYQAEMADIAELTLFAQTGKTAPEASDVVGIMAEQASHDPVSRNRLIASSAEFIAETSNMNSQDKIKYLDSITNNPTLVEKYTNLGIQSYLPVVSDTIKADTNAYKRAYTAFIRDGQLPMYQAIAGKESWSKVNIDMHVIEPNLQGEMYKKFMGDLSGNSIIYASGQFDGENAIAHIEARGKVLTEISAKQAEIAALDPNSERAGKITTEISSLQAKLNTQDFFIDNVVNELGITYKGILDENKEPIVDQIQYLGTLPTKQSLMGRDNQTIFSKENPPTFSKKQASIIYETITNNPKDPNIAYKELINQGIKISASQVTDINKQLNTSFSIRSKERILNHQGYSLPIETIGYVGKDSKAMTDLNELYLKILNSGNGAVEVIHSKDSKRVGTTLMNPLYGGTHKEKIKGFEQEIPNITKIEPVVFKENSAYTSSMPTYRVTAYNPTTGKQEEEIVRFTNGIPSANDSYKNLLRDAAVAVTSRDNKFPAISMQAAKAFAGLTTASLPVKSIGTRQVQDMSLASVMSDLQPRNGVYDNVTFDIDDNPLIIKTYTNPSTGNLQSDIFSVNANKTIFTLDNAKSPLAILDYLGADLMMSQFQAIGDAKSASAISRTFGLPLH